MQFIPLMQSIITPVFSVTWSFRNNYSYSFLIIINIENSCAA